MYYVEYYDLSERAWIRSREFRDEYGDLILLGRLLSDRPNPHLDYRVMDENGYVRSYPRLYSRSGAISCRDVITVKD